MKGWNVRTLVELYGTERLLIEGHRGVRSFGPECICIGASFGAVVVRGRELGICCMSREQLVIRGHVEQVLLEERA